MINKRALVVDDSRSARVVLSRTLESFGIVVDAVESAEIALDYLNATRPDVIFMDHLMTGMDGLAAVRIIKANPRTANIPVFMYSSQQEPAFIHASRIAGALGVLPKTFSSADVGKMLQQLQFAARSAELTAVQSASRAASIKQFTSAQLIALIGLGSALIFCIAALAYSNYRLQQQLAVSQQHAAHASSTSSSSASLQHLVVATPPLTGHIVAQDSETVPYGDVPLAGSRLDRLRDMISDLNSKSFKGVVRVEVFTGDFCLQGNANDGYRVAPAELPIKQCELLGNPFADVLSVQQRQSASFSAFVAGFNPSSTIRIQLADGGRQLATPYPPQLPGLKAGEWNLSAARNNRVEFTASAAD